MTDTYTRLYVEAKGNAMRHAEDYDKDWTLVSALGVPMYARKNDLSVTPCLVRDGYWESWITAWFLNELKPNTYFIDIGANTGYYSMIAASKGVHVTAYEPNQDYVDMIRASINIGWHQSRGDWLPEGHFNVHPMAVSNKVGTATLTIPGRLEGSASITDVDLSAYDTTTKQVMTVNLDHHMIGGIGDESMLIKVDAEGAEELVWDGAFEVNYRHKPVWMIEHTPGVYSDDFLSKLEAYGDLSWINHDGAEEPINKGAIAAYGDWLMLVVRPRG